MKTVYALILCLALLFISTNNANSQQPKCAPYEHVKSELQTKYDEHPIGQGINNAGVLVVLFASKSGSFSVVAVRPDRIACLMTAGEDWHAVEIKPEIES